MKFMKIAREQGHEATLTYINLKINGRIYTLEQLDKEEQARKEVCEQPNITSNPKRRASDRSPYKKRKDERKERAHKMTRNIMNSKTSKERDVRGTGENDGKQKTSNRKIWNKTCDKV